VQKDNVGETTVLELQRVELLPRIPTNDLARPDAVAHGRVLSGQSATIPFTYVGARKSHLLVAAKVNDADTRLVFDTGGANYFSPSAAHRFGLKVFGGINLSGPGESSTSGGFASVDKISIGSAELRDEIVMVGPMPFGGGPDVPDGLAGYEFLSEFRTTIDYPAQTITFVPFDRPPSTEAKIPFYSDGHSIYIEAEFDGQRGLFIVDTGAGHTIMLFPHFARQHGLYQSLDGKAVVTSGGVGGAVTARPIELAEFTLGGVKFRSIPAQLSQNVAGAFASRSLAGSLGGGILRCFRITIDYRGRWLTLALPPNPAPVCPSIPQS
jgi:predicted aspartyl protease